MLPLPQASLGVQRDYSKRILAMFGASIVRYWPLWEPSGTAATDISGNAGNGTYSGVTLGQTGIGDGHTAVYLDGNNRFITIYSADLNTNFPRAEGAFFCWAKCAQDVLDEAAQERDIFDAYIDASNYVRLVKPTGTARCLQVVANGGGTGQKGNTFVDFNTLRWINIGCIWKSANYVTLVIGGDPILTATGLGTLTGNLNSGLTMIGNFYNTATVPFKGYLAHAILLNRAPTLYEMAGLASLRPITALTNIMPYGDSASTINIFGSWVWRLGLGGRAFREYPTRIAVSSRTTALAQAAIDAELAAASGSPDYILFNLGRADFAGIAGGSITAGTWQTQTAYILDAMHAKWANCKVVLARPWEVGATAAANTLAGWQDTVLATRSAWASAGPDERIFYENGDNGATYLYDGVHPNEAGCDLDALQWRKYLP